MNRFYLCIIFPILACGLSPRLTDVAKERATAGDYDGAIALYRQHMNERLQLKDRPAWENPYFYLLLIGDVELQRHNIKSALNDYEEAEEKQVAPELITDRFIVVAKELESEGKYDEAVQFLKKYRDRDPILINSILDRLVRKQPVNQS